MFIILMFEKTFHVKQLYFTVVEKQEKTHIYKDANTSVFTYESNPYI